MSFTNKVAAAFVAASAVAVGTAGPAAAQTASTRIQDVDTGHNYKAWFSKQRDVMLVEVPTQHDSDEVCVVRTNTKNAPNLQGHAPDRGSNCCDVQTDFNFIVTGPTPPEYDYLQNITLEMSTAQPNCNRGGGGSPGDSSGGGGLGGGLGNYWQIEKQAPTPFDNILK